MPVWNMEMSANLSKLASHANVLRGAYNEPLRTSAWEAISKSFSFTSADTKLSHFNSYCKLSLVFRVCHIEMSTYGRKAILNKSKFSHTTCVKGQTRGLKEQKEIRSVKFKDLLLQQTPF